MTYALHLFFLTAIFGILAMSLSILTNWAGILFLAQGAFFGLGAYLSGIISNRYHVQPVATLPIALLAGFAVGFALSLGTARCRGDDTVLVVFAFQLLFADLLKIAPALTGGNNGMRLSSDWQFWGLTNVQSALVYTILFAIVCTVLIFRLNHSAFGRTLFVYREDEVLCAVFGHDNIALRNKVFAITGAMASGCGVLYAHYIGFIDPTSFGFNQSILVLSMVLLGGSNGLWSPFAGAIILVLLPELLRFAGASDSQTAYVKAMIYGVAILLSISQALNNTGTRKPLKNGNKN